MKRERSRDRRRKRCRRRRPDLSGFTLIEMIVATFLLTIGIVGVMTAIEASFQSTGLTEQAQIASLLAQRKMTDVEINSDTLAQRGNQQGTFDLDFPGFAWKSEIEPTEFAALYRVTVTVQWGKGHDRHTRAFVTYLRDTSSASQGSTGQGSAAGSSGAGNAGQ